MYDLLIIGAGGAGLSAGMRARELGLSVVIVSKNLPTQAQTCMAQGGINATISPKVDLSIDHQKHIDDTLASAHGIADEEMVRIMCEKSTEAVSWLDSMGVPFSRVDGDSRVQSIAQRRLGGAKQNRACYAEDYTGLKILHTLYDRAIVAGVEFISELYLLNLIRDDKTVLGASFWDISHGEVVAITAKDTILATGGYANIYQGYSTNANGTIGDGIASALSAGAELSDMEFVQFHPTALEGSAILISESARGEGGYLLNHKSERFIDELAPRDVVARAIFEQISLGHKVFLDIRHLGKEKIERLMPQELHLCRLHAKKDPIHEIIPIMPVAHYTMGGISVDINSCVEGLDNCYAIGECSNSKVHGANRLGGNSLLEIIVFGKRVSEHISQLDSTMVCDDKQYHIDRQIAKDEKDIEAIYKKPNELNFYQKKKILGKMLYRDVGISREHHHINEAMRYIAETQSKLSLMGIGDKSKEYNHNLVEFLEFKNLLTVAKVMVSGALHRRESRGAHYRKDFPTTRDRYRRHITYIHEESSRA